MRRLLIDHGTEAGHMTVRLERDGCAALGPLRLTTQQTAGLVWLRAFDLWLHGGDLWFESRCAL